ncbi:hypothetical protein AGDE_05631 [Angomonas deanei]|nr:hypothetical protein AGDE_05631 [Angomonas deanei]|eukprot:EPY38298.1 hypothetical protein AGDE_05631 [Angomonas deanei]
MERAVREGKTSPKAMEYFKSIADGHSDFTDVLKETQTMVDGQDPQSFTNYQYKLYSQRISQKMAKVSSERLLRTHSEETTTKQHVQDGTPTGENYWYEAGKSLSSPGVPPFIKDEVIEEMRQSRKADSPAFDVPPEQKKLVEEDPGYAEHLRNGKKHLFSGTDL